MKDVSYVKKFKRLPAPSAEQSRVASCYALEEGWKPFLAIFAPVRGSGGEWERSPGLQALCIPRGAAGIAWHHPPPLWAGLRWGWSCPAHAASSLGMECILLPGS